MGDMPPIPPTPPMESPDAMGGEDPMAGGMDNEMPDAEGSEGGAGSDVKEYSGELSQALNSYNEENPNDEEHINKYAINMIAAQVADYLSDKDKRSVIKKLNGNEDDMSSDEQPEMQPQMESRIVKEVVDELINGRKPTKRDEKFITNKKINNDSPFISKQFGKRG